MRHDDLLADLLLARTRWIEEALLHRLHSAGLTGLTRTHSVVAAHIDDDGTRESELARRAGVSRQSMHKVVNELRALGLLHLAADPSNRSAKLVTPTDAGHEVLRRVRRVLGDLEDEVAGRIGPVRARRLREALQADWGPVAGGTVPPAPEPRAPRS